MVDSGYTPGSYIPDRRIGGSLNIWNMEGKKEIATDEDYNVYVFTKIGYTGPATSEGKLPQRSIIKIGETLLDQAHGIPKRFHKIEAARWPQEEDVDSRELYDFSEENGEHKIYLYDATDGPSSNLSPVRDWLEERLDEAEDFINVYKKRAEQAETEEERKGAKSMLENYREKKEALDTIIPRIVVPDVKALSPDLEIREETVNVAGNEKGQDVYNLQIVEYKDAVTSDCKPTQTGIADLGERLIAEADSLLPDDEETSTIPAADSWNEKDESWEDKYEQDAKHKIYLCTEFDEPYVDMSTVLDWLKQERREAGDIIHKYEMNSEDAETEDERDRYESLIEKYKQRKKDLDKIVPRIVLPKNESSGEGLGKPIR